jgi:hypothetical protein
MRLWTRPAWLRLAGLLVVVAGVGLWSWWNMIRMPLRSFRGPLPPLNPVETALRDGLRRDVATLAGKIGDRNVYHPSGFRAAADFIETNFVQAGYTVKRQTFEAMRTPCVNLEAERAGASRPAEIIVLGAHYDTVQGCPGANDNGSAVASLLALARQWSGRSPGRTLRFVAFANEEPPFFGTESMGSLVYARRCRERREQIVAMFSLETMGYFDTTPGSQKYPFPVGLFYPSRGDFIGFVSHTRNAALVRQCVASFRRQADFPSEGAALPAALPGIGWSDHWAFWQAGYPALMITDTAPFRYPHYHSTLDTPDKLDYDRLARVIAGVGKVIEELAHPQP